MEDKKFVIVLLTAVALSIIVSSIWIYVSTVEKVENNTSNIDDIVTVIDLNSATFIPDILVITNKTGGEMWRITTEGDFYWKGELVSNISDIIDNVRKFFTNTSEFCSISNDNNTVIDPNNDSLTIIQDDESYYVNYTHRAMQPVTIYCSGVKEFPGRYYEYSAICAMLELEDPELYDAVFKDYKLCIKLSNNVSIGACESEKGGNS